MFTVNHPEARSAAVQSRQANASTAPNTAPHNTVKMSDFICHSIPADGECLFRSVLMGLHNSPGVLANDQAVSDLRGQLSTYITERYNALMKHAVFGASNELQDLYALLLVPGTWADNAGDLVAPLLAQILGRELHILQPLAGTGNYLVRQSFAPDQQCFPGARESSGPPLYLLQENLSHYSYLEKNNRLSSAPSADRRDEDITAAELLCGLSKGNKRGLYEGQPAKKAKLTIKSEPLAEDAQRTPQWSLVPAVASEKRFYFTTTVDLSRAQTYTDLSGPQAETRTRMPVGVIPIADGRTMSTRPIVQDPYEPNHAHSELPQPVKINPRAYIQSSYDKNEPALKKALALMDDLLLDPKKRQAYESSHFRLAKIQPEHLPPVAAAHPTLGMRGVVAQTALSAGSPLPYSAQYLNRAQWEEAAQVLAEQLQRDVGLSVQQAEEEAARLLLSYSWEGITFNGKKYELSAFGAGNITAMINHDDTLANMGVAYLSSLDNNDCPGPRLVVYFALRDIVEGEQLLVDYGQSYTFSAPTEGSLERLATAEETLLSDALLSLARTKTEVFASTASPLPSQAVDGIETVVTDTTSVAKTSADIEGNSDTVMSLATAKRAQKYQHPPEGYENWTDRRQRNLRSSAREFLKKHNLAIPEWADIKPGYRRDQPSLTAIPSQPTLEYQQASTRKKILIRKRMQRMAKAYNSAVPEWAKPKKVPMIRPVLTDPLALEKPADYDQSHKKLQVSLRRRARDAAQTQQQPVPEWAREKYSYRPCSLDMPEGYEGMTSGQKSHYRFTTRVAAERDNQPVPEWAKKMQGFRDSVLEKPENYEQMTYKRKHAVRSQAIAAAKEQGKEIPSWVLEHQKK